jgi:hypothetical protein
MKKLLHRTGLGLASLAVVAVTLVACGHERGEDHWRTFTAAHADAHRARVTQAASRRLQLDAAQQAKLATMLDAALIHREALPRVAGNKRAWCTLVRAERFDRAKASELLVESKGTANPTDFTTLLNASAEFFDGLNTQQRDTLRRATDRCAV